MFAAHGTQADENENGLLLQSINAPVGKLWLVPQPQSVLRVASDLSNLLH